MALTTRFRLVVETQNEGYRGEYEWARQTFISRVRPLIIAFDLLEPRMGNDEFFTPDNWQELPDDVYGFRLQLYLATGISIEQLPAYQSLAQAITQLMPGLTAWCEPIEARY